jgi:hypothetical protein
MPHSRVYLLGTGTCRTDLSYGQNGACLINGATTFIFDVGASSLERLERVGAFEQCRDLHIHISHRHTDHAIGVFPLLQCLTYSDDARHLAVQHVTIHATQEVCDLIAQVRAVWGAEETCLATPYPGCEARTLTYRPGPNHADWRYTVSGIEIESVHLPDSNNHGIRFVSNGIRYAFTGDATALGDALTTFCRDTDICVFDFGHMTNRRLPDNRFEIDLSAAVDLVSHSNARTIYASHVYVRHLQDRVLTAAEREHEIVRLIDETFQRAKAHGFKGKLLHAQDCLEIT